jgi:hypothetical protein
LRNIIAKQLFSNNKAFSKKLKVPERLIEGNNKDKEVKLINRYQQLLCEVYGYPKQVKCKMQKAIIDDNPPLERQLQKHASVRNIAN